MTEFPSISAEQLLDGLTSGALVVDPVSGKILYSNDVFRDLLGVLNQEGQEKTSPVPAGEAVLANLLKLPPKTHCRICQGTGDATEFHRAFLLKSSGEEIKVKIKHSSISAGMVLCLMDPFSEDVTLTQAHSDFVSTVSHEFRTPLTSIKGFADTLLRYGAQLPADQQKRFISIIKDQADRLTRLVENLLTVSKLGASRMEMSYRPVPLKRMVEKVIQNVRGKAEVERKFEVDIPQTLPEIWADPDKLEQVLLNLVDNAVKYSFPGSEVRVEARLMEEDPDRIRIRISDTGVGIPEEHLPRIFTKFSRIDNPLTREVEGTGLGLYITKSLTNAMEGQIRVESELNKGTVFILEFPVATTERQTAYRGKTASASQEEG